MQHNQAAPREQGQHSAVLRPWRGDDDRAQVSGCSQRSRGDSVDRDDRVLVALERVDCTPRLEVEHTVGEEGEVDACDGADSVEACEAAAAAVELAGAAIALRDTGHEEPLELSPKWAGSPGVHQVVNDRECRLAFPNVMYPGITSTNTSISSSSSMITAVHSSARPSLSFWSARIASDMNHRDA